MYSCGIRGRNEREMGVLYGVGTQPKTRTQMFQRAALMYLLKDIGSVQKMLQTVVVKLSSFISYA